MDALFALPACAPEAHRYPAALYNGFGGHTLRATSSALRVPYTYHRCGAEHYNFITNAKPDPGLLTLCRLLLRLIPSYVMRIISSGYPKL